MQHSTERRNACASGQEKIIVFGRIGGQKKSLARWTRHLNVIAWFEIAQIIAARSQNKLRMRHSFSRLGDHFLADETLGSGGKNLAVSVLAPSGTGNGIQTDFVGATLIVVARRHNAKALAGMKLPRHGRARKVNGDMANITARAAFYA